MNIQKSDEFWEQKEQTTKKAILKGQCLNIAFNNVDAMQSSDLGARIQYARMLYYELQKEKYFEW